MDGWFRCGGRQWGRGVPVVMLRVYAQGVRGQAQARTMVMRYELAVCGKRLKVGFYTFQVVRRCFTGPAQESAPCRRCTRARSFAVPAPSLDGIAATARHATRSRPPKKHARSRAGKHCVCSGAARHVVYTRALLVDTPQPSDGRTDAR